MTTPFTLTQLRYFAAVAEADSMTAAARELMITQSALSTERFAAHLHLRWRNILARRRR